MTNFIKSTSNKKKVDIYFDFHTNKYLFEDKEYQMKIIPARDGNFDDNFFREKYNIFKNTNFYKNYISFNGESIRFNYCQILYSECIKEISLIFNKILHEHKIESHNPYTVKLKISKTGVLQDYILKDAPVVLGLTSIMTYIFFLLTNKFFRRKRK